MLFKGLHAIVTGGCGGLGTAFTEEIIKSGGKVCLLDIFYKHDVISDLDKIKKGAAVFIQCDVSNSDNLMAAFSEAFNGHLHRKLDVVCNNAGIGDETNLEKSVKVNFKAVVLGTELAIFYFAQSSLKTGTHIEFPVDKINMNLVKSIEFVDDQRDLDLASTQRNFLQCLQEPTTGVIVNIASAGGLYPMPYSPYYSATKHAVVGYSRSIGDRLQELESKIRIVVLCPSFVQTDMLIKGMKNNKRFSEDVTKLGGALEPQQVAGVFRKAIVDDTLKTDVVYITRAGVYFPFRKSPERKRAKL